MAAAVPALPVAWMAAEQEEPESEGAFRDSAYPEPIHGRAGLYPTLVSVLPCCACRGDGVRRRRVKVAVSNGLQDIISCRLLCAVCQTRWGLGTGCLGAEELFGTLITQSQYMGETWCPSRTSKKWLSALPVVLGKELDGGRPEAREQRSSR